MKEVKKSKSEKSLSFIDTICNILDSNKAEDINVYENIVGYIAENVIICTAMAERHCVALVNFVEKYLKENGIKFLHSSSLSAKNRSNDWSIIDVNGCMIHIMTEEKRDFFRIDELISRFVTEKKKSKEKSKEADEIKIEVTKKSSNKVKIEKN